MGGVAIESEYQKAGTMKVLPMAIKALRICFFAGMILFSLVCLSGMFLVLYMSKDLPKLPSPLSRIIETPQTRLFDSDGQTLMILGERKTVPLSMVSKHFLNAILAIEDHRFFDHHGINKLRTLKGLYITLFRKGEIQGASTITQQLAKNLFFSFEKTYIRKIKELLAALQIEATHSKEEILHAYINQIHFGSGAQGIQKAAAVFFGKSALDLTLSEAAFLAGLPKSPTNYNPFRHYDRALNRRDIVLKRMVQVGLISRLEAEQAMIIELALYKPGANASKGSYFLDAVIQELVRIYGEDVVFHGGIKVYSTLDSRLQAYAQKSMREGLEELDILMDIQPEDSDHPQGALVAIDAGSGAVKAIVGGRDYKKSQFNRAIQGRRQPGSGFKPFLYYTAFEKLGLHPASLMTDQPVTIQIKGTKDWKPQNFGRSYLGDMILKKALIYSVNTIAAQLIEQTGPENVNMTAQKCGVVSPLKDVYSSALGTSTLSPFEMASAYSVFANLGVYHKPFMFWRVEDAFGRVIFEHILQKKQVLNPAISYQIVDMMTEVIETGSGRSIRKLGFQRSAAGKTGTTDNYNDAWFTGFTPTLCVSVWTGFDKKKKLIDAEQNGITGGRAAAPIWAEFMMNALKSEPERSFPIPADIRFETVNTQTGCHIDFINQDSIGIEVLKVPLIKTQSVCTEGDG